MSSPVQEVSDRVVDLEIRLAYQDRIIADLDSVVQLFAARVEALERALEAVRASMPASDGASAGTAGVTLATTDDLPPHY